MIDDPIESAIRRGSGGQRPVAATSAQDDDPIEAAIQRGSAGNRRRADERPAGRIESTLTALASGIPGMEMMGGLLSKIGGGTYQGGRQHIAARQARAKESIGVVPYEALRMAPEVAAFAVAPVTAAPRLLGTLGGRALMSGGIEAVRGASRTGLTSDEAPSLGEMATGAAKGGALGAAGSVGGELLVRGGLGLGRRVLQGTPQAPVPGQGVIPSMQQGAANMLRSPFAQRVAPNLSRQAAEIIEPIGPARGARVLREELPTPQSATELKLAADEAAETAQRSMAESRYQITKTAAEAGAAINTASRGGRRVIRDRVVGAARDEALALRRAAAEQARQSVAQANEEVAKRVPTQDPSYADEVRESIRRTQVQKGEESYTRAFEMAEGVNLSQVSSVLDDAVSRNPDLATAYGEALQRGASAEARPGMVAALDLRSLDNMRQIINGKVQSYLRGEAVGISRVRANAALQDIDAVENAYISRIRAERGDEAANALGAARAEYREYFTQLDALKNGRNLGRFGFGKNEGAITGNRFTITNLEQTLERVSPEARQAFQVGAREWVNDVIRRTPDQASKLARNLVGTEERYRRAVLALGQESADDLRVVFNDAQSVRDAAKRGLVEVREQARGVVEGARSQAKAQADQAGEALARRRDAVQADKRSFLARLSETSSDAQRANRAKQLSRQADLAKSAVTNTDAAVGFTQSVLPTLTPEARTTMGRVMALQIDDGIMDLMTKPNGAALVAQRFAELKKNPATRAVLGDALEEAERRLRSGVPLRRPVGAVLGGSLAAGMGRE